MHAPAEYLRESRRTSTLEVDSVEFWCTHLNELGHKNNTSKDETGVGLQSDVLT